MPPAEPSGFVLSRRAVRSKAFLPSRAESTMGRGCRCRAAAPSPGLRPPHLTSLDPPAIQQAAFARRTVRGTARWSQRWLPQVPRGERGFPCRYTRQFMRLGVLHSNVRRARQGSSRAASQSIARMSVAAFRSLGPVGFTRHTHFQGVALMFATAHCHTVLPPGMGSALSQEQLAAFDRPQNTVL